MATNAVASRPPERRPTGTPTVHANFEVCEKSSIPSACLVGVGGLSKKADRADALERDGGV